VTQRIGVVTGGNKGIGFEICRQLATKGVNVVLTARNRLRGERAAVALQSEGLNVIFHPLDTTSHDECQALANYMQRTHGRCDILINNAGILIEKWAASVLDARADTFASTLETNFFGALRMSQALIPVMSRHRYGRIVNLSSGLGQLDDMGDGTPAYRVSKTALNALTCMLADATRSSGILVNSMCPGWVRTDMGGASAARGVEKGAETAIWLATMRSGGPTGGFFRDMKRIPW
jgi:NAD(P)-dependent dehydrogenase (short-subunit alcohol dehydrogenase family)